MVVLRLLGHSAERLEQVDDIAPVDVVRGRMGEELIERLVVVAHGGHSYRKKTSRYSDISIRIMAFTLEKWQKLGFLPQAPLLPVAKTTPRRETAAAWFG
jgi:hypothetical protein